MTETQKEKFNEVYQKIIAFRLLISNYNNNSLINYLDHNYLTSKSEYLKTNASTLIQISSFKVDAKNRGKLTNEKIKNNDKVINIHTGDEEPQGDIS